MKIKSLLPVKTLCYDHCQQWLTRRKAMDYFLDCAHNSEGCEKERYMNVYIQLNEGCAFAWDMKDDVMTDLSISIYKKRPIREYTLQLLHKFASAYYNEEIDLVVVHTDGNIAEDWQEILSSI